MCERKLSKHKRPPKTKIRMVKIFVNPRIHYNKNEKIHTSAVLPLGTGESFENSTLVGAAIIFPSACRAFKVDSNAFVYSLDNDKSQTKFLQTIVSCLNLVVT